MKYIKICGGSRCCPSIKEDTENGIMHIIGDDKQDIPFTEEQVVNLKKYLDKRGM